MLSRVARFLWKAVKWTFLVVVTLFALLVLINGRDEDLSDEARALLEAKPVEVPDNENIFVAMAGVNTPEGSDIFEAGRRHIEKAKKELEQKDKSLEEQEKREVLRWKKAVLPFDCSFDKEADFLECARSQKERLEKTLAANETLVRRYLLLQELPHYVAPQNPNVWFAAGGYSAMAYVWRHLAAQAFLDIESGNTEAGLAFFRKDLTFWRRHLEGKSFLVDSMVATSQMTRNAYRLSLLLSSPSINVEKQAPEWRELLAPLSREQARMRPAIEGEIRFVYGLLPAWKKWVSYQEATEQPYRFCFFIKPGAEACSAWQWWLDRNGQALFFQPNATLNYYVPFYKTWLKLTDLSWKDYIEQRDEALAPLVALSEPGVGWIYNPVGKRQSHSLIYVWDEYVGRLYDLGTYLRMVRLQLELRLAKIPSEEIPAFIEQLDEAYCAPCSDFSWDTETRTLSFQPYNEKAFTRHASTSVYVPDVRE
ncbi:MAG: hypothetical protein LBI35_03820 [Burkholderiales bacterium]|jgi:hypothetical protein|nr:hypothetical protein [Burkholderiales bacterium]